MQTVIDRDAHNNLVNILASAMATSVLIKLFGEAGVVYATLVMTLLVLIFAEVLPKDKFDYVVDLQKRSYKVAMVGDGINDSPALSQADIGIAMGHGTDIAIESADITLVKGDLEKIAASLKLSKLTLKTQQTIIAI